MAIFHSEFFSQSLMRVVDVEIILPVEPPEVPKPQIDAYPTLYLLHGFTGRSTDWLTGSDIAALARQYDLAVVMPSGENSFYEDDPDSRVLYSTFVGKELVDLTRRSFPLCHDREHTYIAGLSMGGFGALLNGCRFTDTFSAVACLSGAFIIDDVAGAKCEAELKNPLASYHYYQRVFGDLMTLKGSERDPMYWAAKARQSGRLPRFYLSCGTEDSLFTNDVAIRDQLMALGADVHWYQGPGIHDWSFWNAEIHKVIPWLLHNEDKAE